MRILYIGNMLTAHGLNPTSADTLGRELASMYDVVMVSDKLNKAARLFDICASIVKYRNSNYVIVDTYSSSAFYFALSTAFLCRLLHIKYIPILRGGNLPSRLDRSPWLSAKIFNHSYVNISPSGYLNHEFSIRGYGNVVTIPNNIPIEDCRFKKRVCFGPRILWVRSFSVIYNCPMAVEVLDILLKTHPDAELCMVGPDKDGSMGETVTLARLYGIENHLRITGGLSKVEWHRLSEEYDIFISTTDFDNTPISVIEAMALGLPVVSTNVGGVPYLVKDGEDALLVCKGDAEDMVRKIEYLIFNRDVALSICEKARRKAESFDWNIVKSQWSSLLQ